MRLSLSTDFALRVLIHVGVNAGRLTTIDEIAKSYGISRNHLMKVVHDLGKLGYLETVRGRSGGMRLGREPKDIGIGQVVRDVEDELDVLGCLKAAGYCRIQQVCILRGAVSDATAAFLAVLDGYSLADLIEPREALHSVFREAFISTAV